MRRYSFSFVQLNRYAVWLPLIRLLTSVAFLHIFSYLSSVYHLSFLVYRIILYKNPNLGTSKANDPSQRANILKEVQIMRQLDHPHIIKLVDFSESKQYYYIILELAPGGELFHQIVRLTYFSEDLSRHVIVQVAKALEYLHEEKGVVHR